MLMKATKLVEQLVTKYYAWNTHPLWNKLKFKQTIFSFWLKPDSNFKNDNIV